MDAGVVQSTPKRARQSVHDVIMATPESEAAKAAAGKPALAVLCLYLFRTQALQTCMLTIALASV